MSKQGNIGVFLCQCGEKIAPLVDLASLAKSVNQDPNVAHVDVAPYWCLAPGLSKMKEIVAEKGLDRVLVAGCENRIMRKKLERELADSGLMQGQVEVVNLRGHVAQVSDLSPEQMSEKGAKLIKAAAAGMATLSPSEKQKVEMEGPVMILGGGVATYAAAQELLRKGIECVLAVQTDNHWDELRMLHEHYPGERHYYDRLEKVMEEVGASPLVKRITVGELTSLLGRTGDYSATFNFMDGRPPRVYKAGAIIACLDGQMLNQGADFGHDGKTVICQTEAEELIWTKGVPEGRVVFWINDYEAGHPEFCYLASRTAWSMARYMREKSPNTRITIVHNSQMAVPLSAGERALCRKLGIVWLPYDGSLRPTVQSGYLTCCDPEDHIEIEVPFDRMILSPRRSVGLEANKVARILGIDQPDGGFLETKNSKVRPEQQGREEMFLAGSARYPCDLHEALRQGRRAASKTAEMVAAALEGNLYAPRLVCEVDQSKCIGCGLCKELCDCGGIEPVDGPGGNVPRHVDPMVCTGGGTCAAACPYHALDLLNNTNRQREAVVSSLAGSLAPGEVVAYGCNWGGLAAADNAGVKGLKYDPRLMLLPVGCIGQLDPAVMARALLDGSPGLLLIGCPPEECHHSYGLDHTWSRVNLLKKLLHICGLDRRRIALAHTDLNQPEKFIKTAESFLDLMDRLGPIERNERNLELLRGIYDTVNNARVRWVVGASLRRPWEEVYPGDQRNAMAFDQDLLEVVGEELLRCRLSNLLKSSGKEIAIGDLASTLREDQTRLVPSLRDMVSEGLISRIHKEGGTFYAMH